MIVKAETKHIRISPQKMRLVLNLITSKDVDQAEAILRNTAKGSCAPIIKILKAAVANAKVKGIDSDKLYVSKAIANCGPRWKRFKAAAFGRAAPILRRTSHVKIELDVKS
jgi:large subunit ribosomal protein L22